MLMTDREAFEAFSESAAGWTDDREGAAVAGWTYPHLPSELLPLALADLHRELQPNAPVRLRVPINNDQRFADVCHGAGFSIEYRDSQPKPDGNEWISVRARRVLTLADTVGPGMRLLICGLNPSPSSAETGVGFYRPGNRFWPAALQVGLVSRDRDPRHALLAHGVGMTDLVKRPTRTAAELSADEYREGLDRVRRLTEWLRPNAVCFVGLAGWRAAVDRRAVAGPQPDRLGPSPVYLMPSTSGLNAHSHLPDLARHLKAASDLAS